MLEKSISLVFDNLPDGSFFTIVRSMPVIFLNYLGYTVGISYTSEDVQNHIAELINMIFEQFNILNLDDTYRCMKQITDDLKKLIIDMTKDIGTNNNKTEKIDSLSRKLFDFISKYEKEYTSCATSVKIPPLLQLARESLPDTLSVSLSPVQVTNMLEQCILDSLPDPLTLTKHNYGLYRIMTIQSVLNNYAKKCAIYKFNFETMRRNLYQLIETMLQQFDIENISFENPNSKKTFLGIIIMLKDLLNNSISDLLNKTDISQYNIKRFPFVYALDRITGEELKLKLTNFYNTYNNAYESCILPVEERSKEEIY